MKSVPPYSRDPSPSHSGRRSWRASSRQRSPSSTRTWSGPGWLASAMAAACLEAEAGWRTCLDCVSGVPAQRQRKRLPHNRRISKLRGTRAVRASCALPLCPVLPCPLATRLQESSSNFELGTCTEVSNEDSVSGWLKGKLSRIRDSFDDERHDAAASADRLWMQFRIHES